MIQLPGQQPVSLPKVGEIYWVAGAVQNPKDTKPQGRPALVVWVPKTINGRITIVTRTTELKRRPGIFSPKGTAGLNKDGVWGHRRTVDGRLWLPPEVDHLGNEDPARIANVLRVFKIRGSKP